MKNLLFKVVFAFNLAVLPAFSSFDSDFTPGSERSPSSYDFFSRALQAASGNTPNAPAPAPESFFSKIGSALKKAPFYAFDKMFVPSLNQAVGGILSGAVILYATLVVQKFMSAASSFMYKIVNDISIEDVVGGVSDEVKALIDAFGDNARYENMNANMPRGLLFVGPPGTGKTMLARAIAGSVKAPFFALSMADLMKNGGEEIKRLFDSARTMIATGRAKNVIIFIDEIDAIGSRVNKDNPMSAYYLTVLNEMLVQLDGASSNKGIIVIAATNRPEYMDPALKRAGRFDWVLELTLPNREKRAALLDDYLSKKMIPVNQNVDLNEIAAKAEGFNCPDLQVVVERALVNAVQTDKSELKQEDFELALDRVRNSKKLAA